jgi:uncharacterized SAM-binding protein YcdF (DUF218 family)
MRLIAFRIAAAIVMLWLFLFLWFMLDAFFCSSVPDASCDNVVVLTGEKCRIPHALRSIEINKPRSIFISGVNEKTTLNDILGINLLEYNIVYPKKDVSFILGKRAKNTFENAIEINEWVKKNGIKKILLITSDYHMRRSILEIKHKTKDLEIVPYASKSEFGFRFLKNCLKEFHKTIYVCIKNFLS